MSLGKKIEPARAQRAANECAFPIEDNALIIDESLNTIALGKRVRLALGSAKGDGVIFRFIEGGDAFRFEQFVCRAAPYDSLKTIRIKLRGLRGYCVAVGCRTRVFGRDAVLLRFYRTVGELLGSEGEVIRRGALSPEREDGALDDARRIIDVLAAERPEDARSLLAAFDELSRKSLASQVICDIATSFPDHDPYDVIALAERAARYVGGVMCAETPFAAVSGKKRFSGEVDVSPEHLWYLLTAALGSAVSLSDEKRAALAARTGKRSVTVRVTAKRCALAEALPDKLTLGDLRELCPRSSLRLYLCELICEASGVCASVLCEGGELSISFTLPVFGDDRSFHSADVEPRPEWLAVTEALIIPDAS